MAYPDEILSLGVSKDGSPWVRVPAKSGVNIDDLHVSKNGSPWWARAIVATSWAALSLKGYISGLWTGKPLKKHDDLTSTWVEKPIKKF